MSSLVALVGYLTLWGITERFLLSTAQQRQLWAPACRANPRANVLEAWRALDACLRLYQYAPRKGVTGARSCRKITGGTGYSLHAFFVDGMFTFWNGLTIGLGIAVDINWDRNPYGKRLVTDMPREMVEAILAIRTNNGKEVWGWGGNYRNNKDAMHWELGCSPADLATGINWSTVRGTIGTTPEPVTSPPPPGVESGRPWPGKPAISGGYDKTFRGRFDGNVLYIQKRLNAHSPASRQIAEDGYWGDQTEERVRQFQEAKFGKGGVDGVVGPNTWRALG